MSVTEASIPGTELRLEEITSSWLAEFSAAASASDFAALDGLFVGDAWWRDVLALTWDLRTFHGESPMSSLMDGFDLASIQELAVDPKWDVEFQDAPGRPWIEALLTFKVPVGLGRGVLRLVEDGPGTWKAWTLLTALDGLDGVPQALGPNRPDGKSPYSDLTNEGEVWSEMRDRISNFQDMEPEVVIIGAGQGGLSLAASLGLIGVRTLVIEKNPRVGDNWRNRYRTLVLHDPVWADHLPYVPFPSSWPVYTPKDKLGDWFEAYANTMELNVWTNSTVVDSAYDDASGKWTVMIDRDGDRRTLTASHLVLATGALGEPAVPQFEGMDEFDGIVYHSSKHEDGDVWSGKSAVVVGACNSGHDIAHNLHSAGADVTLVQRSSTYIMSQTNGIPMIFGSLYFEGGPPLEKADLLNTSFPPGLNVEFAKASTPVIAELDQELLDGLAAAGFQLNDGPDGSGLMGLAFRRGGGYYINVGASDLIVEKKITVASGSGVRRFVKRGVELENGTLLEADVVVLATGYQNMRETARKVFGDAVADRCNLVWDLDEEGELNTIWRPSGHPHFWFMGGPLVSARIYSKYLALQIKAELTGLKGTSA